MIETAATAPSPTRAGEDIFFRRPFDRLRLGERWESAPIAVDETHIRAFAELTGDHHPVHVDAGWAASSRFGGLIAHGLLVLSLVAGAAPFEPSCVVAMRGVRDVVLKRAVRAGAEIRVEAAIDRLTRVDAGTGLVAIRFTVRDDAGRVAARGLLDVLWEREGSAGP